MSEFTNPAPAQFPPQKPMELPGKNTTYEPGGPEIEIPGQPLQIPEPGSDLPGIADPPSRPMIL